MNRYYCLIARRVDKERVTRRIYSEALKDFARGSVKKSFLTVCSRSNATTKSTDTSRKQLLRTNILAILATKNVKIFMCTYLNK